MKELISRRQLLKNKMRNRERVFAGWNSFAHPSITEIFTRAGFDFIGIDLEHSTIDQEQSQRIVAACQANGSLCLPRVASHNPEMTRRLLDSGADGLIVPMVSSAGEVKEIIDWCKYPPVGKRGFGISRAQGYGFDFDKYISTWNETSVVIVQIESVKAVKNIDSILDSEDIDGVMIGPYDISGSLGIPGQLTHQKVQEASEIVLKACHRYKKSVGTHLIEPDTDGIIKAFDKGYTFTVLASDVFVLWKWTQRLQECLLQVKANRA